ncbi:MAG: sigma-54 dependent transcriptional regulator [Vicinamibacterales bacterium]
MFKVLVVDDDEQMQFFLKEALEREPYAVTIAGTGEKALQCLNASSFDLVLLDIRLPDTSGLWLVGEILQIDQRLPIIMMTAHGTRDTAIEAMRAGAYDYFTKPFRLDELEIVVRRALEKRRLMDEIEQLRERLSGAHRRGRLIGSSEAMEEVFHLIDRAGPTESTVLIMGESGTGKELVAEAVHLASARREKPFVKLNCAAIPEALLESELFGHERGAFTGAVGRKTGQFEAADGGTLLLDEIGDMTLATQAKILRVLQEREVQRVGGTQTLRVDVRILASTNKDLERAAAGGEFRDDLYYRLNVVTIRVPPLRDRRSEIPELADHFLADANVRIGRSIRRLAPDAMAALLEYHWPGNVRELKNAIERAVVVNDGETLALASLPPPIRPVDASGAATSRRWEGLEGLPLDEKVAQLERAFVIDALTRAEGIQAAAARLLGVSERSVWHLVKKHRIEVARIKGGIEGAS